MIAFRILLVLQLPFLFYLLVPAVTYLLVTLRKMLLSEPAPAKKTDKQFDFAAIVCAHQQHDFIEPLVKSLQGQKYRNIHTYVVADKMSVDLSYLNSANVTILQPKEPLNAKTRSIYHAIDNFIRSHDAIAVFDADNLVHPDFFTLMNEHFQSGARMVQGRIAPKNLNSDAACMDAANETYYTFIDKYCRRYLGLSSGIWGLGFAIDLETFKKVKFDVFLSGFDKKLQATAIQLLPHIAYEPNAVVFDEKTSTSEGLIMQRSKWLFGYFRYAKLGLDVVALGLKKFSFDKVYYGLNHMRPPLVIILPATFLFILIDLFLAPSLALFTFVSLVAFFCSVFLIIATYASDKRVVNVLSKIPYFISLQLLAMLKVRKAARHIHTAHHHAISIEEVMEDIKPYARK